MKREILFLFCLTIMMSCAKDAEPLTDNAPEQVVVHSDIPIEPIAEITIPVVSEHWEQLMVAPQEGAEAELEWVLITEHQNGLKVFEFYDQVTTSGDDIVSAQGPSCRMYCKPNDGCTVCNQTVLIRCVNQFCACTSSDGGGNCIPVIEIIGPADDGNG